MPDLVIALGVSIPEAALDYRAVRAGGPGGQHVNKVSSKVELRVAVSRIEGLTTQAVERLTAMAGFRLTAEGELVMTSSESRHQFTNKQLVTDKLVELVRRAIVIPTPRRATKPSKGQKLRRLDEKKQDSQKKQARRFKHED